MERRSRTLRPFHGVVVVVIAVLFGEVKLVATNINTLLPDGKELCETPTANVKCILQANTGSENCTVRPLPRDNCFKEWTCSQNYTVIKGVDLLQKFDGVRNVTTLTLLNYKENILLLRTDLEEEHWWEVDLPEGEHNVTIFDLPGRLNEENPIMSPRPQTRYCEACPSPLIKWLSYKNLHLFQVVVSSAHKISNVTVKIYGTNETNWVNEDCESTKDLKVSAVTSGKNNEIITAEELYSKGHCFMIYMYFSSGVTSRFKCLEYEDMTVTKYEPARAPIDVPVWWIVVLVWVIVCLVVASLVPLLIHKDLLRIHCKGFRRSVQRHNVDSPPCAGKERSRPPESRPILEDANAPTAPHHRLSDGDELLVDVRIMQTKEK